MLKNLIRGSVAAFVVVTGLVSNAFGADFDVNATITGLALRGVDPVSYFTNDAPQDGVHHRRSQRSNLPLRLGAKP